MSSSYSERTKVVDAMILYCSIGMCLAELEQLRYGLTCISCDELIKNYPAFIKTVFRLTFSREMTATFTNFKEVMDHTVLGSEGFGRI